MWGKSKLGKAICYKIFNNIYPKKQKKVTINNNFYFNMRFCTINNKSLNHQAPASLGCFIHTVHELKNTKKNSFCFTSIAKKEKKHGKKLMKLSTNQISVSFIERSKTALTNMWDTRLIARVHTNLLFCFFSHRKKIEKQTLQLFFLLFLLVRFQDRTKKNTFVILKYEVHQSVSLWFNEIKIQTSTRILKWNET